MMVTMAEVEQLRAKGWYFQFTGDGTGWHCLTVGIGFAHGEGGGKTIEEAAETALGMARSMEDDPKVILKEYGPQIEKLALETFGKGVFQGMEVVQWEIGEPARISLTVKPSGTPKAYVDQEWAFIHRSIKEFPKDVSRLLVFEVDWDGEEAKA